MERNNPTVDVEYAEDLGQYIDKLPISSTNFSEPNTSQTVRYLDSSLLEQLKQLIADRNAVVASIDEFFDKANGNAESGDRALSDVDVLSRARLLAQVRGQSNYGMESFMRLIRIKYSLPEDTSFNIDPDTGAITVS